MKKLIVVMVVLLAIAALVSCDPYDDANKVLGKWECVRTTSGSIEEIIRLDVKEDNTVAISQIVSAEMQGSGTWTAASTTNGTFEFEDSFSYFNGSYVASPNKLTLNIATGTLIFTRK